MTDTKLDLTKVPARLRADIQSVEALLGFSRGMLGVPNPKLVAAYASRADELSDQLAEFQTQARAIIHADNPEAAAVAAGVGL